MTAPFSPGQPINDPLGSSTQLREGRSNVIQFPERRAHKLAARSDTSVFLREAIRLFRDIKGQDRQIQKLLNRAEAVLARLQCRA